MTATPNPDSELRSAIELVRQTLDDSMLTHTGRSIGDRASEKVARDVLTVLEETMAARDRRLELETKQQMKVNIFVQFKNAMAAQSLSPEPRKGTRFRTPLEELTLILEHEAPLSEFSAALGSTERRENNE